MLDRTVQLVKKARELGVWVIHVTEGYTGDYRELDPTNPGGFHRYGISAQAFKTGTPKAASYPPLVPGPNDKDLVLAPRIQTSAFGGTGLNEILRSRGIKNIAVAGFTVDVCDYATVTAGYDLGYHVYALKESMAGWTQPLSEIMLNSVYILWSKVLSNHDFIAMVSPDDKASRQPCPPADTYTVSPDDKASRQPCPPADTYTWRSGLSPNGAPVLALLTLGLSNHAIGARLGIAASTVKTYVAAILEKLDAPFQTSSNYSSQGTGCPPFSRKPQ